jgi:hypothetical protein
MASFETIFGIPSSHVLKPSFTATVPGCPRVGATRNMTAGESLLRGMRAACTQTMTASEQAMAERSLTSKTFSSRQRAICLYERYERTCPHRRADYTARHHRPRRRRSRLASLSGILRGEYPQPAHTPRLQPRRVGIYDLVRRRQRSDIDHASGSISFRRRPRASIKTGISRILRMRQDVDRGRLTAPPLHRRSLQKQPDRNREEFRTPLGVRKSARNEPAVCGPRLMGIWGVACGEGYRRGVHPAAQDPRYGSFAGQTGHCFNAACGPKSAMTCGIGVIDGASASPGA